MSEEMVVLFTIPGDPRGKGRPRASTRHGFIRMHTDPKTVAYEGLISLQATLAMRGRPAIEGPVEVRIRAYYRIPKSASKNDALMMAQGFITPANKKPDIDNVAKSVMDGCSKGLCFKDDTQVVTLTCTKRYCDNPRVEVSITKY